MTLLPVDKDGMVDVDTVLLEEEERIRAAAHAQAIEAAWREASAATGSRAWSGSQEKLEARCRAYVERMPPAISGWGGHQATFRVALAIVKGFGLDTDGDAAWRLLSEYNERCQPPWSDKELRHKLDSAAGAKKVGEGWLRDAERPQAAESNVVELAPQQQGAKSEAPTIHVMDAVELAKPLPPLDYLVEDLALVAGGGAPHLVAGYGFSGKTLSLQAMLLAMAADRPVWGSLDCAPRRVLHVDLEQGERLTAYRYQRLASALDIQLAALKGLGAVIMPPLALRADCAGSWRALMQGRDVIVIDSLRVVSRGVDENSSDMRAGLDMLGALSNETGCRPIVIHHARKPPAEGGGDSRYNVRGSSAIYDACDAVLVFSANKGEPVLVECAKARSHGQLPESVALVIDDVGLDGVQVSVRGAQLVQEQRERIKKVKGKMKAHKDGEAITAVLSRPEFRLGLSARQLREQAGLSGSSFKTAIESLGDAVRVESLGPGKPTIYRAGSGA